jgi:hypothetical protein
MKKSSITTIPSVEFSGKFTIREDGKTFTISLETARQIRKKLDEIESGYTRQITWVPYYPIASTYPWSEPLKPYYTTGAVTCGSSGDGVAIEDSRTVSDYCGSVVTDTK